MKRSRITGGSISITIIFYYNDKHELSHGWQGIPAYILIYGRETCDSGCVACCGRFIQCCSRYCFRTGWLILSCTDLVQVTRTVGSNSPSLALLFAIDIGDSLSVLNWKLYVVTTPETHIWRDVFRRGQIFESKVK